jgi:hypothetical protein
MLRRFTVSGLVTDAQKSVPNAGWQTHRRTGSLTIRLAQLRDERQAKLQKPQLRHRIVLAVAGPKEGLALNRSGGDEGITNLKAMTFTEPAE